MLPRANKAAPSTLKESTDAAEVAAIRRAIEVAGGNVSAAAAALGLLNAKGGEVHIGPAGEAIL